MRGTEYPGCMGKVKLLDRTGWRPRVEIDRNIELNYRRPERIVLRAIVIVKSIYTRVVRRILYRWSTITYCYPRRLAGNRSKVHRGSQALSRIAATRSLSVVHRQSSEGSKTHAVASDHRRDVVIGSRSKLLGKRHVRYCLDSGRHQREHYVINASLIHITEALVVEIAEVV